MTKQNQYKLSKVMGPLMVAWTLLQLSCIATGADAAPKGPDGSKFVVRVSPKMSMPPGEQLLIVAEVKDPGEAEYCPGVRIEFGQGQSSETQQDCPGYAEYQQSIKDWNTCHALVEAWGECMQQVCVAPGFTCVPDCAAPPKECRQPANISYTWSWRPRDFRVGFGPGKHALRVVFWLPNDKSVEKAAEFLIAGEE